MTKGKASKREQTIGMQLLMKTEFYKSQRHAQPVKQVPWSASTVKKENWILWKQFGKELGNHIQTMLWGWHFKNVFALYSNHFGTFIKAKTWHMEQKICSEMEEQSDANGWKRPRDYNLAHLTHPFSAPERPRRAVICGEPVVGQALRSFLQSSTEFQGDRSPGRLTILHKVLDVLRDGAEIWIQFKLPAASEFNSLLTLNLILFLPCQSPSSQAQVQCLLSMFQGFTDGTSLELLNTNKELLLKSCSFPPVFIILVSACFFWYLIQLPCYLIVYSLWDT